MCSTTRLAVLEGSAYAGEHILTAIGFVVSSPDLIEVMYERDHATGDSVVFHAQKATPGTVRRYMDV